MSGAQFGRVHPLPPAQRSIHEVGIIAETHWCPSLCLRGLVKASGASSCLPVLWDSAPWGGLESGQGDLL